LSGRFTPILRFLPHGPADALRQLGLFVVADLLYETVRGVAEGREAAAFANARAIVDIEKATGTFFEPGFQSALMDTRWLVDAANFAYMNTHFVITTAFLVWLYLFRNDAFYFVRNMFMVAMGLALIGYTLLPTAPPRLLAEYGFVDTITAYSQVNHDSALVSIFVNPYAAVPSMHMAFSLLIAIPAFLVVRNRAARVLWAVYPAMVFFVIIVTANHFWLDAAAGALVAGASALAARTVLGRLRPAAWSWRAAPGEPAAA